jgi:DNA-binding HxlR family transcriptional regulator
MIRQVKRYGQRCALARALDVVGERWSLLVVRELCLGARRYRDLLDGLPGIPTNLLANRLRDLQAAGVVAKRTLPPPAAVTVYELTDAGRALAPALSELRDWGARYGPAPAADDEARPAWALLSAAARPTTLPAGHVWEVRVDSEPFQLSNENDTLAVRGGQPDRPDVVLTLPAEALYLLLMGSTSVVAARRAATIDGDDAMATVLFDALHGTLAGRI